MWQQIRLFYTDRSVQFRSRDKCAEVASVHLNSKQTTAHRFDELRICCGVTAPAASSKYTRREGSNIEQGGAELGNNAL